MVNTYFLGLNSHTDFPLYGREVGIKYLTLFAFSVENWERPAKEVQALMALLEEYLIKEIEELQKAQNEKEQKIFEEKRGPLPVWWS